MSNIDDIGAYSAAGILATQFIEKSANILSGDNSFSIEVAHRKENYKSEFGGEFPIEEQDHSVHKLTGYYENDDNEPIKTEWYLPSHDKHYVESSDKSMPGDDNAFRSVFGIYGN